MTAHKQNKKGFSLVELSIIIIIAGLLMGALVAGQVLMKNAQWRQVMGEVRNYKIAVATFKLKYSALPGDIANAYDFWGSSCNDTASYCNGDADGQIYMKDYEANTREDSEAYRAWQHLALSQLIPGTYSGQGGQELNGTDGGDIGWNMPESVIRPDVGYIIKYTKSLNLIQLARSDASQNNSPSFTFMETKDAKTFDMKFDDGLPSEGRILGDRTFSASNSCVSSSAYNLSFVGEGCYLQFLYIDSY
jgi:type II secretory pathway pseudopilin PulG